MCYMQVHPAISTCLYPALWLFVGVNDLCNNMEGTKVNHSELNLFPFCPTFISSLVGNLCLLLT